MIELLLIAAGLYLVGKRSAATSSIVPPPSPVQQANQIQQQSVEAIKFSIDSMQGPVAQKAVGEVAAFTGALFTGNIPLAIGVWLKQGIESVVSVFGPGPHVGAQEAALIKAGSSFLEQTLRSLNTNGGIIQYRDKYNDPLSAHAIQGMFGLIKSGGMFKDIDIDNAGLGSLYIMCVMIWREFLRAPYTITADDILLRFTDVFPKLPQYANTAQKAKLAQMNSSGATAYQIAMFMTKGIL